MHPAALPPKPVDVADVRNEAGVWRPGFMSLGGFEALVGREEVLAGVVVHFGLEGGISRAGRWRGRRLGGR